MNLKDIARIKMAAVYIMAFLLIASIYLNIRVLSHDFCSLNMKQTAEEKRMVYAKERNYSQDGVPLKTFRKFDYDWKDSVTITSISASSLEDSGANLKDLSASLANNSILIRLTSADKFNSELGYDFYLYGTNHYQIRVFPGVGYYVYKQVDQSPEIEHVEGSSNIYVYNDERILTIRCPLNILNVGQQVDINVAVFSPVTMTFDKSQFTKPIVLAVPKG
ncbi:MAG: hypothetical protein ABIF10_01950 [Candidatus Woesearchaeota archaeon]